MTTRISRPTIQNLINDLLAPADGSEATKAGQIYAAILNQGLGDLDRMSLMLSGAVDLMEEHIPPSIHTQFRHRVDCMVREMEGKQEKKNVIKSSIILN